LGLLAKHPNVRCAGHRFEHKVTHTNRRSTAHKGGEVAISIKNATAARSDATPIISVVDDDILVREAMESIIRAAGWQARVFALAREFLDCPRVLGPGCLILDVMLPDLHGLELQRLVADRPETSVIFMANHGDIPTVVQAMKAGAIEFMIKPFCENAMVTAIGSAIERSRIALRREYALRLVRGRYASLSLREQQVMAWVVEGTSNKVIAGELGITEATVKAHRGKVMRKMQARSAAELINVARKLSLPPVRTRTEGAPMSCPSRAHRLFESPPAPKTFFGQPDLSVSCMLA
jgi:FixJ family two-component response regulator